MNQTESDEEKLQHVIGMNQIESNEEKLTYVDEIKCVYRDVEEIEEADILHLAQAKCYLCGLRKYWMLTGCGQHIM